MRSVVTWAFSSAILENIKFKTGRNQAHLPRFREKVRRTDRVLLLHS
jgi:hypothetical protein